MLGLILLCVLSHTVVSTKFVVEQVATYKQLLGSERLTYDGFKELISLHDDWQCVGPCDVYATELFGAVGGEGVDWNTVTDFIVDKIYGDAVSYDPYEPQEVHLALTGDIAEMKVMWVTGSNLDNPYVQYRVAVDADWSQAMSQPAINYTYTVPQYWWPVFEGVIYEANMTGLLPKTAYSYRVGGFDASNQTARLSKEFIFNSAPSTTDPNQKVTIGTLGDQGTFMFLGFATSALLAQVQDEREVDMVMIAGDLCYAGLSSAAPRYNITADDEFEHIWDLWGIQNEPIAATRPLMVGVGNHEKFYNFSSFNARYKMPAERSGGSQNFWYSYDYGNVHWVSVSSEHSLTEDSEQMNWIVADLEAATANRANVPWIVMSLHRPVYCSSLNSFSDTRPGGKYQQALEPLLLKYDVDLTVTGHMHCYERIHPNEAGRVTVHPCNKTGVDTYFSSGHGPVHVVQGNTGAMQDTLWVHPKPKWSAKRFANGFVPSDDRLRADRDHLGNTGASAHDVTAELELLQGGEGGQLEGLILSSNYTDTYGIGIATFANSTHLYYETVPITGTIGVDAFWVVKHRQ